MHLEATSGAVPEGLFVWRHVAISLKLGGAPLLQFRVPPKKGTLILGTEHVGA